MHNASESLSSPNAEHIPPVFIRFVIVFRRFLEPGRYGGHNHFLFLLLCRRRLLFFLLEPFNLGSNVLRTSMLVHGLAVGANMLRYNLGLRLCICILHRMRRNFKS